MLSTTDTVTAKESTPIGEPAVTIEVARDGFNFIRVRLFDGSEFKEILIDNMDAVDLAKTIIRWIAPDDLR